MEEVGFWWFDGDWFVKMIVRGEFEDFLVFFFYLVKWGLKWFWFEIIGKKWFRRVKDFVFEEV